MQHIPVKKLRAPIRHIDKQSKHYQDLMSSVRAVGFTVPIAVEQLGNYYNVLDGVYRSHVANDLGLQTIPANIT